MSYCPIQPHMHMRTRALVQPCTRACSQYRSWVCPSVILASTSVPFGSAQQSHHDFSHWKIIQGQLFRLLCLHFQDKNRGLQIHGAKVKNCGSISQNSVESKNSAVPLAKAETSRGCVCHIAPTPRKSFWESRPSAPMISHGGRFRVKSV